MYINTPCSWLCISASSSPGSSSLLNSWLSIRMSPSSSASPPAPSGSGQSGRALPYSGQSLAPQVHSQVQSLLCLVFGSSGWNCTVNCFDDLHQAYSIYLINIMVTVLSHTLSLMVKYIITLMIINHSDSNSPIMLIIQLDTLSHQS